MNSKERKEKIERNLYPSGCKSGKPDTHKPDIHQQKEKETDITWNSREIKAMSKKKKENKYKTTEGKEKGIKDSMKEHISDSEENDVESRVSFRQSLKRRLQRNTSNNDECCTSDLTKKMKEVSPSISENSVSSSDKIKLEAVDDTKVRQKKSLLEKVNEIINSCVRLKDEKKITGSKLEKANKIIQKAEEKKLKLKHEEGNEIKDSSSDEEDKDKNLANPGDLKPKEEEKIEECPQKTPPEDLEEGEITDTEDTLDGFADEILLQSTNNPEAEYVTDPRNRKDLASSSYNSSKSSVQDELHAMSGHSNKNHDHSRRISFGELFLFFLCGFGADFIGHFRPILALMGRQHYPSVGKC